MLWRARRQPLLLWRRRPIWRSTSHVILASWSIQKHTQTCARAVVLCATAKAGALQVVTGDAAWLPLPGALHPARRDRVAEADHLIEDVAKAALRVVAEGDLLGTKAAAANQFLGSI